MFMAAAPAVAAAAGSTAAAGTAAAGLSAFTMAGAVATEAALTSGLVASGIGAASTAGFLGMAGSTWATLGMGAMSSLFSIVNGQNMANIAQADADFKSREMMHESIMAQADNAITSRDKVLRLKEILARQTAMGFERGISLSPDAGIEDSMAEYSKDIDISAFNAKVATGALERGAAQTRAAGKMESSAYRFRGWAGAGESLFNVGDRIINRGSVPRLA